MSEQRDSYFVTCFVVGCVVVTWWCKCDVDVDVDVDVDDDDVVDGDDVNDSDDVLMTVTLMLASHWNGTASFYAKW